MHLNRNRRGALEGLPLYLIILVVVAAVVIVILLGWLSTLNKPSLGNATTLVDGLAYTNGITSADATFTNLSSGACLVNVHTYGGAAVNVTTYDTHSNTLGGVTVTIGSNSNIDALQAAPGLSQTTGGNGQTSFASLTFQLQPDFNTGSLALSFQYSGGVAPGISSQSIAVDAPYGYSC